MGEYVRNSCLKWSVASNLPGTYSEPCQTSKMELFAKIVNGKLLTPFAKGFILDVWQGSEYASAYSKGTITRSADVVSVSLMVTWNSCLLLL